MKKKTFDHESLYEFIWNGADNDGIWSGNEKTLAAKFRVPEDQAYVVLGDLCDHNLIQRVGKGDYIITRWPERSEPGEDELRWWEFTATLRHR